MEQEYEIKTKDELGLLRTLITFAEICLGAFEDIEQDPDIPGTQRQVAKFAGELEDQLTDKPTYIVVLTLLQLIYRLVRFVQIEREAPQPKRERLPKVKVN